MPCTKPAVNSSGKNTCQVRKNRKNHVFHSVNLGDGQGFILLPPIHFLFFSILLLNDEMCCQRFFIPLLLLKWLHHLSQARWSLSNPACLLRLKLCTYRDLRDWLNDPYNTPLIIPLPEQLELPLMCFGQGIYPRQRETANIVPKNVIQKGKTFMIAP